MRHARPGFVVTFSITALFTVFSSCGDSAPATIVYGGETLKKARSFKIPNGVKEVVYTADGMENAIPEAPRRVSVLWASTDKMRAPGDLHGYLLEVGTGTRTEEWYALAPGDGTACTAGRTIQNGRSFRAVHVCGPAGDHVACGRVDEAFDSKCHMGDKDCKKAAGEATCAGLIDKLQPELMAIAKKLAR